MRNPGLIKSDGATPTIKVGDVVAYKQSPVSQGGMQFLTVTNPDNGDGTFTATPPQRNFRGRMTDPIERDYWLEKIYWNDTTGEIRS